MKVTINCPECKKELEQELPPMFSRVMSGETLLSSIKKYMGVPQCDGCGCKADLKVK